MARILVVENDPDQAELRRLILEAEGHSVALAATVEAALEAARNERPDRAIVDLRLPALADGLALIRGLKRESPATRIIVVSGYPSDLQGREEAALVEQVLAKPVRTAALLRLLALLWLAILPLRAADALLNRHAPILERRENVRGTASDVPLLMYAERLRDPAGALYLQYSVIFSNEDGGTATRALMARWGRTTDIEHVYRVWIDPAGNRLRAMIQGKNHQELEFTGPFEGDRPLLRVITDNNMVGPGGSGAERASLGLIEVNLDGHSREKVMDDHPEIYRLAAAELEREGKLSLIGDPRRYLYVEAEIANHGTRFAACAGRHCSHAGNPDWAIERSGFVRTAIQLPEGTGPAAIDGLRFLCLNDHKAKPAPAAPACQVLQVTKVFFLDSEYRPQPSLGGSRLAVRLTPGAHHTWKLPSK